ncbi:endonuclease/exonuclease/phosphatase family protein [Nocardioides litoris]|uniref:endonuclease/exonuclease/phosphatase family protein n=1 Tax=Nocardioides litoris TaxID=1926648 RepID=UPI00111F32AA|nr:endonuclease/exonuclease/phosphatase family protein [Nocardioides litoris]
MSLRTRWTGRGLVAAVAATVLVTASPAPGQVPAAVTPVTGSPVSALADGPATTAVPTPERLRFLTYNIRYGSYGLPGVLRDIRRTRAEVVLLNEVDDRRRTGGVHQVGWLARRLGMTWVYDADHRTARGTRGNAVLSRHRLGDERASALPWPRGTQRREAVRVTLTTSRVRAHVWVTHLNPGRGTVPQARTVSRLVGDPTCLTLVGGDTNDGPGTPVDDAMRRHLDDTWRDVGRGPGHTNFQGVERIDYLYHRHLVARRAWTTPLRASDHRGVVGVLDLDPRLSC